MVIKLFSPRLAWRFVVYIWNRGQMDSVRQWAASLTYTSLLAIVPLLSVSFAIFSAFPAFKNFKQAFQDYIFANFSPSEEMGLQIQSYFNSFVSATGTLPTVGVMFLAVSSVLLLLTINIAFNRIWHVRRTQSLIGRLLMFWSVLTIVPLLMGAGLSILPIIQNFVIGVADEVVGHEQTASFMDGLLGSRFFLPFIFEVLALLFLFMVVPNAAVAFKDAFWGAVGGAVALELLKSVFGLYLNNSNYTNIYGALALVPIFLLWVFTCWNIILFSAVAVASLPEWRAGMRDVKDIKVDVYNQFDTALSVLYALWVKQQEGGRMMEAKIIKDYHLTPWLVYSVMPMLEEAGWVQKIGQSAWVLSKNLAYVKLFELFEMFLSDNVQNINNYHEWEQKLSRLMGQVTQTRRDIMNDDIAQFFSQQKENLTS